MSNENIKKNIGHATSYGYAKSTGRLPAGMDEDDYAELMADYVTVGQTAVAAKNAAVAAKDAAETAAGTATTKADEAGQSATTATNAASAAQAYADAAALDASQAMSAASTATSKATEAASSASTATAAKTDAVAAKTAAQAAQTAAETAEDNAEASASAAAASAASVAGSAAQIAQNASDITELKEDFATMESDGVVPSADQILTDKGVTDSVPYHFRKTGGNGADREYDQIVGGTVNFNQLTNGGNSEERNGITWTNNNDGTWTANGTASDDSIKMVSVGKYPPANHVICAYGCPIGGGTSTFFVDTGRSQKDIGNGLLAMSESTLPVRMIVKSGTTVNNLVFKPQAHDLTQMFGSTIADYIYQLEQTTAGGGVAFFKSLFPNDYYPYDSGTLKSVEGLSEHKMTGKNLLNTSVFEGSPAVLIVNADGSITQLRTDDRNESQMRTLRLKAGTYTFSMARDVTGIGTHAIYYRDNNAWVYAVPTSSAGSNTFTLDRERDVYIKISAGNASEYPITLRPQIELGATATTYEPYKAHSYPLDDSLTLRGLFKLDANNNLYYDGDTYEADGTVTRKYREITFNGSDTSGWSSDVSTYGSVVRLDYSNALIKPNGDIMSNLFVIGAIETRDLECINTHGSSAKFMIQISASKLESSTLSGLMTYFASHPLTVLYELATPTTEEAEPYQHLQQCDPNGTEEYVTTGIVPVGHNTKYPENLRAKIEGLPWDFATLIAPTESTYTATRNYTTGALFIVDNVLYKATSNIANGGAITPNTNCTATTLAEIISALA